MKKRSKRDREANCLKLAVCQATVPCPSGLPTWEQKPRNQGLSSSSAPDDSVTLDKSFPRAEPMGWMEQFLPMLMARRLDFDLHLACWCSFSHRWRAGSREDSHHRPPPIPVLSPPSPCRLRASVLTPCPQIPGGFCGKGDIFPATPSPHLPQPQSTHN